MLKRALIHVLVISSILTFPWLCYLADPLRSDGTLVVGVVLAVVITGAYSLGAAQVQRQERRTPPRRHIPRPRQPLDDLPRRRTR